MSTQRRLKVIPPREAEGETGAGNELKGIIVGSTTGGVAGGERDHNKLRTPMAIDLVLKLREVRRMRGMSQRDVARLSGVGVKTISSFETGDRIGSLKLAQLERLLGAYGLTAAEFFGRSIETEIAPWELDENQNATARLLDDLHTLPASVQRSLLDKFQLMIERSRRCMPPSERKSRPRLRHRRCRQNRRGSDS